MDHKTEFQSPIEQQLKILRNLKKKSNRYDIEQDLIINGQELLQVKKLNEDRNNRN